MPIIAKPPGRGPLFGGKAVISFGGYDKEAMRRWQERVRAAKIELPATEVERGGGGRSADLRCGD